jgi:hypothetical protein
MSPLAVLLLASMLAQEPPPPAAPQESTFQADSIRSREEGDEVIYEIERPRLTTPELNVSAERAEIRLDAARYHAAIAGEVQRADEPIPDPLPGQSGTVLPGLWSRKILRGLGLPEDETLIREIVLTGAVRIRTAELEVLADVLRDQPAAGRMSLEHSRLSFAPGSGGPNGWPISLYSDLLEEEPDGSLNAQDAVLTTCEDPEPHYGLRLGSVRVSRLENGSLFWQPDRGWLEILGRRVLPLPTPDFEPGESFFGLRGARSGVSDKYGTFFELRFRGEEDIGGTNIIWNFYPSFSTRRGFPLATEADLKAKDYRAHWELFYLEDEASDKTGMRRVVGRDSDNRWRVRMDNVWDLSEHWRAYAVLDVTSDPLVDPEFFTQSWSEEEDAGSDFSLVRQDEDSYGSFRVRPRLDDVGFVPIGGFPDAPGPAQQTMEDLPRVNWEGFSSTLTELSVPALGGADGELAVNVEYGAELGRMRLRDRDLTPPSSGVEFLDEPTLIRSRARAWTEIALPAHGTGMFWRPGARFAGSVWEDDTPGAEQGEQLTAEGFLEMGAALNKRWDDGWSHRVVPQLRLRARGEMVESDFVPPVTDGLDRLSEGEVAEFSLRQFFLAPGRTEPWLDLDLLAPYYPNSGEVLTPLEGPQPWGTTVTDEGFGPVELRGIWSPGAPGAMLDGVRFEGRLRHDFIADKTQEIFTRVDIRPGEQLSYGLDYYETEGTPADFAYGSIYAGWRFTERWALGFRESENFSGDAGVRTNYAVQYYGHDFLFETGYTRHQTSGDVGFYFNITPRFFFDPYGSQKLARLRW